MRRTDSPVANAFSFAVNAAVYGESVLFKCFYWYGDRYAVTIDLNPAGTEFLITLVPLRGEMTHLKAEALAAKIKLDLIDFKTRDLVAKETAPIRQILLAKAFDSAGIFENAPTGQISDPVGFEIDDYE